MAKPRFTLYKHIKIEGTWRYCRAAVAINNKVKPHIVVVGGTEEKHEDGSYCVRHKNQWIEVGNDPAEALRRRTKLSEQESPAQQTAPASGAAAGTPLAEAAERISRIWRTVVWTLKVSAATEAASIRSSSVARSRQSRK